MIADDHVISLRVAWKSPGNRLENGLWSISMIRSVGHGRDVKGAVDRTLSKFQQESDL
jgi:hypothetical protein